MRKSLSLLAALAAALPAVLAPLPSAAATQVVADQAAADQAAAVSSSVVVRDVALTIGGTPVSLFVVAPAAHRGHANAGILFLHLFAPGTVGADRTEYLADAVALAQHGTVSFLPQGTFPWAGDPVGTRADARAIRRQLAVFRGLLDRLAMRSDVDPTRVAVVGHDYGAMYGALLAQTDRHVHVAVLETPDATWENWFLKFWLGFEGDQATQYAATFAGLEPVSAIHGLGARLYLQFADNDFFIPEEVRTAFAASDPEAKISLYAADHELNTDATTDRLAWLETELSLAG
jgi:pimeloyl-ACP methyl ester carboxylesterase